MRDILAASPRTLSTIERYNLSLTDLKGSPTSARDSGYARSEGPSGTDQDSSSDDDDDDDGRGHDDRTARISHTVAESPSDDEFNRRARALTESPMADVCPLTPDPYPLADSSQLSQVTQAFTSLGSFSLPPPNSPTRRPTFQRIRSSPSHFVSTSLASTRTRILSKPYAVPGNFSVPSSGPQPVLKKHVAKSVEGTASLSRGVRALRM